MEGCLLRCREKLTENLNWELPWHMAGGEPLVSVERGTCGLSLGHSLLLASSFDQSLLCTYICLEIIFY